MISFDSFIAQDGVPIYLQIVKHIKSGIVSGTVVNGDEVPSRRVLSADKPLHALEYRDRIVQSPERVDTYIKAQICKLVSDIVGEAASEHGNLVMV